MMAGIVALEAAEKRMNAAKKTVKSVGDAYKAGKKISKEAITQYKNAKKTINGIKDNFKQLKRLAASGDKKAQAQLNTLRLAKDVRENQRTTRILKAAEKKDPQAIAYIDRAKKGALAGNIAASVELNKLREARKGQKALARAKKRERKEAFAGKIISREWGL